MNYNGRDWSKEVILPHPTEKCLEPGCGIRTDSGAFCRQHELANKLPQDPDEADNADAWILESERRSDEDTARANARFLDGGWIDRTSEAE